MKLFFRLLLVTGLLFFTGCSHEVLYGGLTEADANSMLGLLLARGLDADKLEGKGGTFSVSVPRSQFAQAVSTLQWFGLPKQQYQTLGDLFQKSGMVSSPTEERIRYVYGLSQTLAETLSKIDGVVTSRVNLVLPDNDPFSGSIKPSSASVFLRFRPGLIPTTLIPNIKQHIANSVEGLSFDRVSVTISQAESLDYFFPADVGTVHQRFLGLKVDQGEKKTLWLIMVGFLSAGVLASLGLIYVFRNRLGGLFPAEKKGLLPARPGIGHD
jgi:type III secretion protein J